MMILRVFVLALLVSDSFASPTQIPPENQSSLSEDEAERLYQAPSQDPAIQNHNYESFTDFATIVSPTIDGWSQELFQLQARINLLEANQALFIETDDLVTHHINALNQFKQSWGAIFLLVGSGACVTTASLMEQFSVLPTLAGWLFVGSGLIFLAKGVDAVIQKCKHARDQPLLPLKDKCTPETLP